MLKPLDESQLPPGITTLRFTEAQYLDISKAGNAWDPFGHGRRFVFARQPGLSFGGRIRFRIVPTRRALSRCWNSGSSCIVKILTAEGFAPPLFKEARAALNVERDSVSFTALGEPWTGRRRFPGSRSWGCTDPQTTSSRRPPDAVYDSRRRPFRVQPVLPSPATQTFFPQPRGENPLHERPYHARARARGFFDPAEAGEADARNGNRCANSTYR
ncbi:hypothetical protein C8R47DRAFT_1323108 [Mycena vitilis]|nr:hypothetical protein C8R47DRAFT_1323108 [Mycena vitilis]